MTFDGDQLAGLIDPFGVLSRAELRQAVREVTFRRGDDFDEAATEDAIDAAVETYRVVACPPEAVTGGDAETADELLAVGPTAFPASVEGSEDLPHILDADRRTLDRETLGLAVVERLRGEAARAVARGDDDRVRRLMDVSYDVETWAPVDVSDVRDRFDSSLADDEGV